MEEGRERKNRGKILPAAKTVFGCPISAEDECSDGTTHFACAKMKLVLSCNMELRMELKGGRRQRERQGLLSSKKLLGTRICDLSGKLSRRCHGSSIQMAGKHKRSSALRLALRAIAQLHCASLRVMRGFMILTISAGLKPRFTRLSRQLYTKGGNGWVPYWIDPSSHHPWRTQGQHQEKVLRGP